MSIDKIYDSELESVVGKNPLQRQVGGNHYKTMKIQPLEFIEANELSFCLANAVKYICRHKNKNGLEDIEKAIHYLELHKEIHYADQHKK